MVKKIALLALALITLGAIPLISACGGSNSSSSPSVSLKNIVPQKANILARISLEQVLNDKDISDLYASIVKQNAANQPETPATIDQALKTFQDKTGLDIKQFQTAAIFGDMTNPSQIQQLPSNVNTAYMGIIVNGTFANTDVIAGIEKANGKTLEYADYHGFKVYAVNIGTNNLSLFFPGDGVLVIGPDNVVKDVIDVKNGSKTKLDWDLLETYGRLGDGVFKVAVKIPSQWMSSVPDQEQVAGMIPINMKPFKDATMVGAGITKNGNTVAIQTNVTFSKGSSATSAKNDIDSLLKTFKGLLQMAGSDAQAKSLSQTLDSLDISASGNTLTVHMETSAAQVKDFAPLIQGLLNTNGQ